MSVTSGTIAPPRLDAEFRPLGGIGDRNRHQDQRGVGAERGRSPRIGLSERGQRIRAENGKKRPHNHCTSSSNSSTADGPEALGAQDFFTAQPQFFMCSSMKLLARSHSACLFSIRQRLGSAGPSVSDAASSVLLTTSISSHRNPANKLRAPAKWEELYTIESKHCTSCFPVMNCD